MLPHDLPFHCERFDTALLRKIIETDLDVQVRMHEYDERDVTRTLRCQWVDEVLEEVGTAVSLRLESHSLLPEFLNEEITRRIAVRLDGFRTHPGEGNLPGFLSIILKPFAVLLEVILPRHPHD